MCTISSLGYNVLRIDAQDWALNMRYGIYSHFSIAGESDRYRLTLGASSGTFGYDDLAANNGMQFATIDRPDANRCASSMHAGWWYNYCSYALPNGKFYNGGAYPVPPSGYWDGIYYKDWTGYNYSLKYFTMTLYKQ